MPAPLRFELGVPPKPGEIARAVLVATVDDDGSPRIAVISTAECIVTNERRLRIELRSGSATCANLSARRKAALWYVLDGAAYTLKGNATAAQSAADDGWRGFDVELESVWRDFEQHAPMVNGPAYRAAAG